MPLQTDEDGFLLDPEDWDESIALQLAREFKIDLNDEQWDIIHLIRTLYFGTGTVPELRTILKQLKRSIGKEKATRKYVYTLFPYGYGQQACKIAGMRKPLKLWLDL